MKKIVTSALLLLGIGSFMISSEASAAEYDTNLEPISTIQRSAAKKKYYSITVKYHISSTSPGTYPHVDFYKGYMYSGQLDYKSEKQVGDYMVTRYAGYLYGYKFPY